jgi:hypothetical protein
MRNSPGIDSDFVMDYKNSILNRVSHIKSQIKQSEDRSISTDRKNDPAQYETIRQSDLSGATYGNDVI